MVVRPPSPASARLFLMTRVEQNITLLLIRPPPGLRQLGPSAPRDPEILLSIEIMAFLSSSARCAPVLAPFPVRSTRNSIIAGSSGGFGGKKQGASPKERKRGVNLKKAGGVPPPRCPRSRTMHPTDAFCAVQRRMWALTPGGPPSWARPIDLRWSTRKACPGAETSTPPAMATAMSLFAVVPAGARPRRQRGVPRGAVHEEGGGWGAGGQGVGPTV